MIPKEDFKQLEELMDLMVPDLVVIYKACKWTWALEKGTPTQKRMRETIVRLAEHVYGTEDNSAMTGGLEVEWRSRFGPTMPGQWKLTFGLGALSGQTIAGKTRLRNLANALRRQDL